MIAGCMPTNGVVRLLMVMYLQLDITHIFYVGSLMYRMMCLCYSRGLHEDDERYSIICGTPSGRVGIQNIQTFGLKCSSAHWSERLVDTILI